MEEFPVPTPAYPELLKKWRAEPYDGLKGLLPEWFPEYEKGHFSGIQGDLCRGVAFGQVTEMQLLQDIHRYANNPIFRFHAGMARMADYYFLADLWLAKEIAERQSVQDALRFLLGDKLANAAQTGAKVKAGTSDGHKKVHGTKEEKAARWNLQQDAVTSIHAKHPNWSWEQISKEAAGQMLVSQKTIKRHVPNPKRPKNS